MSILVTGGTGFVLSNFVFHWLTKRVNDIVIVVDSAAMESAIKDYFTPFFDRVVFIEADLLDPNLLNQIPDKNNINYVIHGAAITPSQIYERDFPRNILNVNALGTAAILECMHHLPKLKRFLYISSGSVYGEAPSTDIKEPQTENGHTHPVDLYGITKLFSEYVTERYGELYNADIVSVRLSNVYGPMERETQSRKGMSLPYTIINLALDGKAIKINTLEAGGDYIYSGDVAKAIYSLMLAPELKYGVYNIAYGKFITIGELLIIIQDMIPNLKSYVEEDADIILDPSHRCGQWGAYDISRMRDEFGWNPLPIQDAIRSYIKWLRAKSQR